MKQRALLITTLINLLVILLYLLLPLIVSAEDQATQPSLPPVLITEVQAGSAASASEEFIELYNTTAEPIDLSAYEWQLQIASSSAANWDTPFRSVVLDGVLAPGQSYVVASQYTSGGQTMQYLPSMARRWFSAGIAAAAGHVRLVYATNQPLADNTCGAMLSVVDEVEWSAPKNGTPATASLDGRTVFVTAKASGLAGGTSLQRLIEPSSLQYRDSGEDTIDFIAAPSTPGAVNGAQAVTAAPAGSEAPVGLPADGCDPNPPVAPVPEPEQPPTEDPGGSGGSDGAPEEQPPAEEPPVNQGLQPPSISELLPNPGAPQTDDRDEFVELYNPNAAPFDVSGYVLEAGTATKRRYIFPDNTILPALSYTALYAGTTGLSLSNSGGQVRLIDPTATVLSVTDPYTAAKDNQAWALVEGIWQWTLTPTPNAANAATPPPASIPKKKTAGAAKTAAAKTKPKAPAKTKVKAAKTAKARKAPAHTADGQLLVAAAEPARSPLHPGVLAVVGGIAVLYGAYEYRQDMANYFRRLRNYRESRREDRPEPAGRGDD